MTALPHDALPEPFSDRERQIMTEAGIAVFGGRLVLDAQPPIDEATLAAVAERCAGPLPEPLVALWRTSFGGRVDYDLRTDLDGQDVPVSFTELFYPDSGGYHDLWGWIAHECELAEEHQPDWSGRLVHLPIGGFEYLDRAAQAALAGRHAVARSDRSAAERGQHRSAAERGQRRSAVLAELADRFDPDHRS